MTLDELNRNGWKNVVPDYVKEMEPRKYPATTEDRLRVELLEAKTRIFQLEREIEMLRGKFPKHGPSPEFVSPKVRGKIAAHGTLPTRRYIYEAFSASCFYCHGYLFEHKMTLDHQIPKSKGGSNARSNLVSACGTCNTTKGDRMPTPDELERANIIRKAYDSRPKDAQPIDLSPQSVAKFRDESKPNAQWTVRMYSDTCGITA